jgi:hypothetical protein
MSRIAPCLFVRHNPRRSGRVVDRGLGGDAELSAISSSVFPAASAASTPSGQAALARVPQQLGFGARSIERGCPAVVTAPSSRVGRVPAPRPTQTRSPGGTSAEGAYFRRSRRPGSDHALDLLSLHDASRTAADARPAWRENRNSLTFAFASGAPPSLVVLRRRSTRQAAPALTSGLPRIGASAPARVDARSCPSQRRARAIAINGKHASAIWAGVRGSRRASRTCAFCECARQHVGAGWTLAALAFAQIRASARACPGSSPLSPFRHS